MTNNLLKQSTLDSNFNKILNQSKWYETILLIQNDISHATFEFFKSKNIYSVHVPVTTGSVTSPMGLGSDSLPVQINLFGVKTYLADSMQFHLEYLLRLTEAKGVHYMMPTFRGEDADNRHLAQFYHSECEITGNLLDVITLVNEYTTFLAKYILKYRKNNILNLTNSVEHIEKFIQLDTNVPQISFEQAQEILKYRDNCFDYDSKNELNSLTSIGESELIKHFNGPIWVKNYPYKSVPFYQKMTADKLHAENADLLMGIGETVGCGERCVTIDETLNSMNYLNVNTKEYDWYLKMKDRTPIPTSGFGLGVERFILWILKHDDIRDIQLIKRENGKLFTP